MKCSRTKIIKLIRRFRHGDVDLNLESGNCGMFAFALADKLAAEGCEVDIGFVVPEDIKDLPDLEHGDYDLYHVVLVADGRYYDANGEISVDDLIEFAENNYDDPNPALISEPFEDDTRAMIRQIITWNTAWTCPWESFSDFIEGKRNLDELIEEVQTSEEYETDANDTVQGQRTTGGGHEQADRWYHISFSSRLEPSLGHELMQGQMGRGFYVTREPLNWEHYIGCRPYWYEVVNQDEFVIAKPEDSPNREQLMDWAIEQGYFEMVHIHRRDGEPLYELDGVTPLIRPELTEKGKRLFDWKDPMTGQSLRDLENQYLWEQGFDGAAPAYSPDGDQILIFDPTKVILEPIPRIAPCENEDDDDDDDDEG